MVFLIIWQTHYGYMIPRRILLYLGGFFAFLLGSSLFRPSRTHTPSPRWDADSRSPSPLLLSTALYNDELRSGKEKTAGPKKGLTASGGKFLIGYGGFSFY